jgi:hypothetical protein
MLTAPHDNIGCVTREAGTGKASDIEFVSVLLVFNSCSWGDYVLWVETFLAEFDEDVKELPVRLFPDSRVLFQVIESEASSQISKRAK